MYKIIAIENGTERELNITPYEDIKLCKEDVIELNKHYLTKLLKQSILDCISIKKDNAESIKILVDEPDDNWIQIYSLIDFITHLKDIDFNKINIVNLLRLYGINYMYTYKEI